MNDICIHNKKKNIDAQNMNIHCTVTDDHVNASMPHQQHRYTYVRNIKHISTDGGDESYYEHMKSIHLCTHVAITHELKRKRGALRLPVFAVVLLCVMPFVLHIMIQKRCTI
jgi:hypothetical protein